MTRASFLIPTLLLATSAACADAEVAHRLNTLTRGEDGQVILVARADPLRPDSRLESIGLRGEYRDGRVLWVDRRQDGGTVIGLGYQRRF